MSVHLHRPSRITTYAPDADTVENWRERAACQGLDTEIFFPVSVPGTPARAVAAGPALSVCDRCKVREDCLADALSFGEQQHGIAGGLDEHDRRALLRGDRPSRQLPHQPRAKRHCDRGHALTDHSVYERHGIKHCRICRDEAEQVAS